MTIQAEAIIVGAGQGRRIGAALPKVFLPIGRQPLLVHTLSVFLSLPEITGVVLVIPPGEEPRTQKIIAGLPEAGRIRSLVAGGARRQDSVHAGLDQVAAQTRLVLVHDAARPFVTPELIRRVLAAAAATGAAVPGVPVTDTLKRIDENSRITATVDRRQLQAIQTPQGFQTDILRRAYAESWEKKWTATDDAGLVERLGLPVAVVPGDPANFKVTTQLDLRLAECLLRGGPTC